MAIPHRVAVLVCLLAPYVRADDWPRWRGPRGDGLVREEGLLLDKWPREFTRVWTAKVGAGYAGPVAADGKVYLFSFIDGRDTLTCYDADTGKLIWTQSYKGGWDGGYPGTRAMPNIDGDRIYTYGGAGDLVAWELATGKPVWHLNVLKETRASALNWAAASNPLIDGDLIYVQNGNGSSVAVAVDKKTGKLAWRSQARGTSSYAHPILAEVQPGRRQLIVYAADGPVGMDPATGKTIWQHPWSNGAEVNASDPVFRDGHLFVTSAYDQGALMLKFAPDGTAKRLWENPDVASRFQPAILDGEHLYVNSEGTLRCLKWPRREVVWSTSRRESNLLGVGGSMLRVGGDKMIVLSQSGRLTLARVTPAGFEQIASVNDFVEGSEVWATPAIHNGKLYAKGSDELVCVDIRAKP